MAAGGGVMPTTPRGWMLGLGFFGAMIVHELVLEAASRRFGELGLTLSQCVTLAQFLGCAFVPFVVGSSTCSTQPWPTTRPALGLYLGAAALVWGSTALATQSLVFVSYPTKVVVKSAKLLPTMAVSRWLHGTRFTQAELLAALLLCLGTAGYAFDPHAGSSSSSSSDEAGLGLVLLAVSVCCDSLVPNLQQKILATGITASQLMVNVNVVGLTGVAASMAVAGQWLAVVHACWTEPALLLFLTTVGGALSLAVFLYTQLIRESGSVVAVAVATIRKGFTVVLSYVVFPKPVTAVHVLAGLCVLGGVVANTAAKGRPPTSPASSPSSSAGPQGKSPPAPNQPPHTSPSGVR